MSAGSGEDARGVRVEIATGAAVDALLAPLARLRIEVFRAFPYLYDGDLDYEETYLAEFAAAPGAVIVAAYDGARMVGASTGAPMAEQDAAWSEPFRARGDRIDDLFYCGESVLDPAYRGRGLYHAFFDEREAQARRLGLARSCFCGVVRPENHPLRPADYRPLDAIWRRRGYAPLEGVIARFAWKDVDQDAETEKPLQFWGKRLVQAPLG